MDDRGRLAQSLKRGRAATTSRSRVVRLSRLALAVERWSSRIDARLPRRTGIIATALFIIASLTYGAVKGEHVPAIVAAMQDVRDRAATAAGFGIVSIALTGHHHVTREEVLATAGITGMTSLVFLDVEQTRER